MNDRPGLRSVVVDCVDPSPLARFWADALGWVVRPYAAEDIDALGAQGLTPETDPSVCVDPPDASLPTLWFNRVPEPKVGKVRMQMDVNLGDAAGIHRVRLPGGRVEPQGGRARRARPPPAARRQAFVLVRRARPRRRRDLEGSPVRALPVAAP